MNIREAAAGLQFMDDYLNEASAATVMWDVGVLLGRITAQGEEIERQQAEIERLKAEIVAIEKNADFHADENERLREALKFITTTRPDGAPAYSEASMFDVAADALKEGS
jgi:hypothetical protein